MLQHLFDLICLNFKFTVPKKDFANVQGITNPIGVQSNL